MTYAIIAEKTGWTPGQISGLNLETVRMLVDSWVDLAEEAKTDKPKKPKAATMADVRQFQSILKGVE